MSSSQGLIKQFTPLQKLSDGWLIQLDGKTLFAHTQRDFIVGKPVQAQLTQQKDKWFLNLTKLELIPVEMTTLMQVLVNQGKIPSPERLEKLSRHWQKAPGNTDQEKARFLSLLEDKNLLLPEIMEGLNILISGDSSSNPENSKSPQDHSPPSSEKNQDDDENLPVHANPLMGAALDLFHQNPGNKPFWILIPFKWTSGEGEYTGLSRFYWDPLEKKVLNWSFGLNSQKTHFYISQNDEPSLSVFSEEIDLKTLVGNPQLGKFFSSDHIFLEKTINFDGFEPMKSVKIMNIDETA